MKKIVRRICLGIFCLLLIQPMRGMSAESAKFGIQRNEVFFRLKNFDIMSENYRLLLFVKTELQEEPVWVCIDARSYDAQELEENYLNGQGRIEDVPFAESMAVKLFEETEGVWKDCFGLCKSRTHFSENTYSVDVNGDNTNKEASELYVLIERNGVGLSTESAEEQDRTILPLEMAEELYGFSAEWQRDSMVFMAPEGLFLGDPVLFACTKDDADGIVLEEYAAKVSVRKLAQPQTEKTTEPETEMETPEASEEETQWRTETEAGTEKPGRSEEETQGQTETETEAGTEKLGRSEEETQWQTETETEAGTEKPGRSEEETQGQTETETKTEAETEAPEASEEETQWRTETETPEAAESEIQERARTETGAEMSEEETQGQTETEAGTEKPGRSEEETRVETETEAEMEKPGRSEEETRVETETETRTGASMEKGLPEAVGKEKQEIVGKFLLALPILAALVLLIICLINLKYKRKKEKASSEKERAKDGFPPYIDDEDTLRPEKPAAALEETRALHAAVINNKGRVRKNNEDNFFFNGKYMRREKMDDGAFLSDSFQDAVQVYAVCDGMGGADAGEEASYRAVKELVLRKQQHSRMTDPGELKAVLRSISEKINQEAMQREQKSGTTIVMMAVSGGRAVFANVGDSRIYRFRDKKLVQISLDHSKVQRMIAMGILTPEQAKTDPGRHVITQYLGMASDIKISPYISEEKLCSGDIYLLCSDGLTDMVEDDQIETILNEKKNLEEAVQELLKTALKNGGRDNVTIMLIRS